ncbi:hypothetical protein GGQ22_04295 [Nocardioides sp. zg-579]|uniref:DUF2238 domain-containing protein n=1 Tax=Nocardioides marmotae TaxID=2663857 RepID=A0A6I3J9P0_9ACTN|nr:hypothetical protein [Nocardioides marmotae]MCR6030662.1 hypothetical protein [Gordonia jinghuaiqii]MTB94298.1 hypothetical protein [Nocardioides marmotae]QKE00573.1 hypothetical protein HPC71_05370 [Nocardioides marmotae]
MDRLVAADGLRVVALVSLLGGLAGYGWIAGAVFFLVLGGTMVPRAVGAPGALDATYCLTILVAAWAAVLDWYLAVPWLDVVVHAAATGLIAALVQFVLVRVGMASAAETALRLPRSAVMVMTTATGTTLAVVWELGEWFGHTYLDSRIQVGYDDTMGDLAAGMVGALVAGVLLGSGLLLRGVRR